MNAHDLTISMRRAMADARDHGRAGGGGPITYAALRRCHASLRQLGLFNDANELTESGRALLELEQP